MRRRPESDAVATKATGGTLAVAALLALTTCLSPGCAPGDGDGAEPPEPRQPVQEQRDAQAAPGEPAGDPVPPDSKEQMDRASRQAGASAPEGPTSPEEIQRYTRELAASIAADRADAERGDLLGPGLVEHLHWTFRDVIEGPGGDELLDSIRENDPGDLTLQVNGTYPEDAPVATMPPQLLERFPSLPEGVEYRFVGCRLILLARESKVVLDYTERCFW